MSLVRHLRGAALLCAVIAAVVPAAHAAPRVETLDAPSTRGNIDFATTRVNPGTTKLEVNVVLPDGYDEQPTKRWPVLFLLHGVGDSAHSWLEPEKGDVLTRAKGLPAIIVLPEGGRSYYTDAWLGGSRSAGRWERYFLDEVLPLVASRYRIAPGRTQHTIAGISMGGYGAELLGSQLPGYFGTVISFSGLHNIEAPEAQAFIPYFSGFSYSRMWGAWHSPYVRAHNPYRLLETGLRDSRLYVSVGNGQAAPDVPATGRQRFYGGMTEWLAQYDSSKFAARARKLGVDITFRPHTAGLHGWAYWRRELQVAIGWGLFGGPKMPADPKHFTYASMAPHGNAWGLGYRFSAPTTDQFVLTRSGQRLRATGRGTVTITPGAAEGDASGNGRRSDCAFTAKLPLTHTLPAGC